PARHAQGHDDLPAHQPADRGPAGLGLRLGDRGRPAGIHAHAARRLQSLCRLGSAVGVRADGASRSARAGVAHRDLFGRTHGDHRADVVLQGDLVRVSAAGLLDRLLRAILLEPFLARGHRQLLHHRVRIDGAHAGRGAARRLRLRALPLPRQGHAQPRHDVADHRARGRERARLLQLLDPLASGGGPRPHDHRTQLLIDTRRLPGHRRCAQGLRPQPRTRRHERRRRAAARLRLGHAAGAAARNSGRGAIRLPALLQRGGGCDLHRRPRRIDLAAKDVRIDPPRIRSRHRRGVDAAHGRGAARRFDLVVLSTKARPRVSNMQIDPLVKPRSVAIVGATDRVGPARSVIESLGAIGFAGPIYPVNPKYQTVRNLVCYPSLTDLPEAPDVVVFSIRKPLLLEQVRLAAKRGARSAVIYDAGFAELGEEGARQQAENARLCREAGMPMCGPNCMRILNPTARATTYKQTVMAPTGLAGKVGIVSQTGSVCIAFLSDRRRYGISLSVSAGNEAVTPTVDYLEYLIDDPATNVIATFTETVREAERYVAALDRAAAVGKPVVVLKVGRAERTQRAITSHTGGLAGESRGFSGVLRAHRAIEVSDLDEMPEVLAVCQGERWPRGRGISVITGSGGLAEMILDNATTVGLDLPPLSNAERAEAERVIGRITGDGNPFDAWGNGNYAVNLPQAMSVVRDSERIAAIVYCADTGNEGQLGHPGRVLENVNMLVESARRSHKPHYLMSSRPGVMNLQQAKALREAGLVQIGGTRQGLGAIDRVGRYMTAQKPVRPFANRSGPPLAELLVARPPRRTINEHDSKRLLRAFGVPVAREFRVVTIAEAKDAARELGYPIVLKALSDEIPHKTELGLVAVGLKNSDELAHA